VLAARCRSGADRAELAASVGGSLRNISGSLRNELAALVGARPCGARSGDGALPAALCLSMFRLGDCRCSLDGALSLQVSQNLADAGLKLNCRRKRENQTCGDLSMFSWRFY
jgi:hypothetical protein